jgi:hypothetical protein
VESSYAAIDAIEAFTHGDFALASERLPVVLPLLGGSAPQRELFEATWRVARQRAGESHVAIAA